MNEHDCEFVFIEQDPICGKKNLDEVMFCMKCGKVQDQRITIKCMNCDLSFKEYLRQNKSTGCLDETGKVSLVHEWIEVV